MLIDFLWVGPTSDPLFKGLENRYLSRLQKLSRARVRVVKEVKKTDPKQIDAALRQEEEAIRRKIRPGSYLVVLDEMGRQFRSRELAAWLQKRMVHSGQDVTFLVGGHQGLGDVLKEEANLKLALGHFTLPHEMARILLLEQIYRAFCIINGLPYHRDRQE